LLAEPSIETSFSLGLQRTPLVNERESRVLCEDGFRRIFGKDYLIEN
jgi:hypothetical protein